MKPLTRRSDKRDAILETLKGTRTHPSVDWIYRELKPRYPDLSLGTVYRNLSAFKDEGRIIAVGVFRGQEHYDADISEHHHLICRECGAIVDVNARVTVDGTEEIEADGCVLENCRIVFHGLCADCAGLKDKNFTED